MSDPTLDDPGTEPAPVAALALETLRQQLQAWGQVDET